MVAKQTKATVVPLPFSLVSLFCESARKSIFLCGWLTFEKKRKILYKHQHAYVKEKSTATAIFELVSEISDAIDKGDSSLALFYDFSKAFDSIFHPLLFEKPKRYGTNGPPPAWIRSFLTGRKQKKFKQRQNPAILSQKFIQNWLRMAGA
jgi:Reverse transcriptase (RNA-dependent DNA polymerase)